MYGSIGKYYIDKQSGEWHASGNVFLGHLTAGKVQLYRDKVYAQQLAEFNARFKVLFTMPDRYIQHPGDILLTIDCFTA